MNHVTVRSSRVSRALLGFASVVSVVLTGTSACSSDPGDAAAPNPDGKDQGAECTDGSECKSLTCTAGKCTAVVAGGNPTDGIKNGDETDVDCGGQAAPKCADGKTCKVGGDCESSSCIGGTCKAPSPDDGIKNGDETDVELRRHEGAEMRRRQGVRDERRLRERRVLVRQEMRRVQELHRSLRRRHLRRRRDRRGRREARELLRDRAGQRGQAHRQVPRHCGAHARVRRALRRQPPAMGKGEPARMERRLDRHPPGVDERRALHARPGPEARLLDQPAGEGSAMVPGRTSPATRATSRRTSSTRRRSTASRGISRRRSASTTAGGSRATPRTSGS